MKCNVGKTDRILRIAAGLALIGWGLAYQNPWGAVGLGLLFTGVVRWCPAYVPFKWTTLK